MSKITRVFQRIFGSTATSGEIKQFGSLASGSPVTTVDPATIQALSQWLDGWNAASIGGNSPAIEDMNAMCFVYARQLAYIFQAGVPEWETTTVYYTGSLVNSSGVIYVSLTDANTGNALTDTANWAVYGGRVRTVTTTDTVSQLDDLIRLNTVGGAFTETLPAVASTPIGKRFTLKNVAISGGLNATVKGDGSELIDQANTFVLAQNSNDSITVSNNGTSWDII